MKKRRPKPTTSDNLPLSEVPLAHAVNCREVDILPGGGKSTSDRVRKFIETSLAPNTLKAYRSDIAHFQQWGGTIPASPEVIAQYLADYADTLRHSTLQRRLVALSVIHQAMEAPNPVKHQFVRSTMRGIRRTRAKAPRRATPLLRSDLQRVTTQKTGSFQEIRDRALLLLGFEGAFRRSELVGINIEDLQFGTEGLSIKLPVSKTDPFRRGRTIVIARQAKSVCAVHALQCWLTRAAIERGAIFRCIKPPSTLGKRLSAECVSTIVKAAARSIGKDPSKFSGHSLRAGYVTQAAISGQALWKIRQQTGHSSIEMVSQYIRPEIETVVT